LALGFIQDAAQDNKKYGWLNGTWSQINELSDCPNDGNTYVREYGTWTNSNTLDNDYLKIDGTNSMQAGLNINGNKLINSTFI